MMKTKFIFIFLFSISLTAKIFAQAPNWQWAKTTTEVAGSYGNSICLDRQGNSYVTGYFRTPTITFGSVTLTSIGSNTLINLYLVKYDEWGNVLWARNAGGGSSSTNMGKAVAVDDSGNVFLAGTFGDTIIFGSFILDNSSSHIAPLFLTKYNSSGNVIWARQMGGGGGDDVTSIATDASGNCYITGCFHQGATASFGNITLTSADAGLDCDVFIAKFAAAGNVLWAQGYGANACAMGNSVSVDASGNCYLAGYFFSSTINFGVATLTGNGGNPFLIKFNPTGNALWAKSGGPTTYYSSGNSVSIDALGNSYLTGDFESPTITFGSFTLTNSGNASNSSDIFLVKYDPSGNVLWATGTGGATYFDVATSVCTDSTGNSYVAGYFGSPSINFGSTTLTNSTTSLSQTRDIFIAKYDPSGNVLWATGTGGSEWDEANSIAIDSAGNTFIAGEFFSPTISFSSTNLIGASTITAKMFIAKTSFFPAGINSAETNDNDFFIFPNPSNGIFTLNSKIANGEIFIYSLLGEKIISRKIISEKTEIDLSNQANGIYFVNVQAENKSFTQRIIIQK